jgi:hypothetical protein
MGPKEVALVSEMGPPPICTCLFAALGPIPEGRHLHPCNIVTSASAAASSGALFGENGLPSDDKNPTHNSAKQSLEKQARTLAEMFSRTAGPIPATGEPAHRAPVLHRNERSTSAAPRHQPPILEDPIDPHSHWKQIAYTTTAQLPYSTAPRREYEPLVKLSHGEHIPDGRTPTAPEHYLEERFCPEPRHAAANLTALRLQAHHDRIHIPRRNALTLTAERVGSLANRTYNSTPVANATCECEACLEPTASLFMIKPAYIRPDFS